MTILLALAVAAQGVSYAPPPVSTRRDVLVTRTRRGGAPEYRIIRRGGFVPSYFANPGFTVVSPGAYGFSRPYAGRRWIRYHDDALLVDAGGRVHDGRYGYDWSRHRDDWGYDAAGIPIYVGDGDFYPEDRDYRWAERMEREVDGQLAYDRDYPYDFRYGGEGVTTSETSYDTSYAESAYRPDAPCAYPCGYTITETTVTMPDDDGVAYEEAVPARRYAVRTRRR